MFMKLKTISPNIIPLQNILDYLPLQYNVSNPKWISFDRLSKLFFENIQNISLVLRLRSPALALSPSECLGVWLYRRSPTPDLHIYIYIPLSSSLSFSLQRSLFCAVAAELLSVMLVSARQNPSIDTRMDIRSCLRPYFISREREGEERERERESIQEIRYNDNGRGQKQGRTFSHLFIFFPFIILFLLFLFSS